MNRNNVNAYLTGLFLGSISLVFINYYLPNRYEGYESCDYLDNKCYYGCPGTEVLPDPNGELYGKIISSEAEYGRAMKGGDQEGMNRAFNTSVFYQSQLKK